MTIVARIERGLVGRPPAAFAGRGAASGPQRHNTAKTATETAGTTHTSSRYFRKAGWKSKFANVG